MNLSNQNFDKSFWGFKVGETETYCESGSMLHYRNKNKYENSCFVDTCGAFWKYVQVPDFSICPLGLRPTLPVIGTCVYKTELSHQVSESGDTFLHLAFLGQLTIVWWKPQSCNLPISCFKI